MGQRDTILIVDDMEVNRVILSGLFQEEYHLLEAENGEQALLLLKQYHGNIAIMLLDVVMPVMDGYQVMKEMGGSGLLDEVPVVVITADNSLEGELRSFDLGASDIIVKPFEPHVVKRRVHNIIELYLHKHNLEDMVDRQAHKLKESNDWWTPCPLSLSTGAWNPGSTSSGSVSLPGSSFRNWPKTVRNTDWTSIRLR